MTGTAVPRLGDWCTIHVLPFAGPVGAGRRGRPRRSRRWSTYARELQDRFPYDPDAPARRGRRDPNGRHRVPLRTSPPTMLDELDAADEVRDVDRGAGSALGDRGGAEEAGSGPGRDAVRDVELVAALHGRRRGPRRDRLPTGSPRASRTCGCTSSSARSPAPSNAACCPPRCPTIPGIERRGALLAGGRGERGGRRLLRRVRPRAARAVGGGASATSAAPGPQRPRSPGWPGTRSATAPGTATPPADVLRSLNRAVRELGTGTFLTVVYATARHVRSTPELTVACGGHPLPIHVACDGTPPSARHARHVARGARIDVHVTTETRTSTRRRASCSTPTARPTSRPPHDLDEASPGEPRARAGRSGSDGRSHRRHIQRRPWRAILPFERTQRRHRPARAHRSVARRSACDRS